MSEILNIEELKKMAMPIIEIPNFDNTGTIKVRVQKPRLLTMAKEGKIPNHLLGVANELITGETSRKKEGSVKIKDVADMLELYCKACLVEPSYEEFKDIITDEQMFAIFDWGMDGIEDLENFREDEGDGSSNNNG